jgi:hypothetical protein
MATYGQERAGTEWPWNVLSARAVAYRCGAIAREGDPVAHEHDPDEFARCQQLAAAAAAATGGLGAGMGTAADDTVYQPFYVVTNVGVKVPARITERLIRWAFGRTIYPRARIWVEPLAESGEWWDQVLADCGDNDDALGRWRAMIRWFHAQSELRAPSFVMIGEDPLDGDDPPDDEAENGGCVFPRLSLALTKAGSVVGICNYVVHA